MTVTGEFHIERLRLNRPALVALRGNRRRRQRLQECLAALQRDIVQLVGQLSEEEAQRTVLMQQTISLLESVAQVLRELTED